MKKCRNPYNFFEKMGAIFLIVTLICLTVSTPFIVSVQQNTTADDISLTWPSGDGDSTDSSNNEKAPSGANFAEEYLNENHFSHYLTTAKTRKQILENSGTYIAYYGELHAPPPNAA